MAFISGVVLALNAVVLALHVEPGYGVAIGGLIVLIAADLALLMAIATPFSGDLRVEGRSPRRRYTDLEVGRYGPRSAPGGSAVPR